VSITSFGDACADCPILRGLAEDNDDAKSGACHEQKFALKRRAKKASRFIAARFFVSTAKV